MTLDFRNLITRHLNSRLSSEHSNWQLGVQFRPWWLKQFQLYNFHWNDFGVLLWTAQILNQIRTVNHTNHKVRTRSAERLLTSVRRKFRQKTYFQSSRVTWAFGLSLWSAQKILFRRIFTKIFDSEILNFTFFFNHSRFSTFQVWTSIEE